MMEVGGCGDDVGYWQRLWPWVREWLGGGLAMWGRPVQMTETKPYMLKMCYHLKREGALPAWIGARPNDTETLDRGST